MEEHGHGRGDGPPDAGALGLPAHCTDRAADEPVTGPPAEGASAPPVVILPTAAGGGAGAVSVPAVVIISAVLPLPAEAAEPIGARVATPPAQTSRIDTEPLARPVEDAVLTLHEPEGAPPTTQPRPVAEAPPEPAKPPDLPAFARPPLPPVFEPPAMRERAEPRPGIAPGPAGAKPSASDAASDIWRTELPATQAGREAPQPSGTAWRLPRVTLRWVLTLAGIGLAAAGGLVLALVALYRWIDPPASTLMLGQRLAGTTITQRWVPLDRISPNLITAVILSEDGAFCRHRGVDWGELKEAIESAGEGGARGGSTISMQVVKNLFLWPSRNYIRKAIEIPLTYVIEAAWSKPRILEIYLNIAEWGPGIFGAEAAARHHFRKPASMLNPREAALLAVALPNPFDRQAGRPGPGTARLADNLLLRMRAGRANTSCVRPRAAPG